MVVRLLLLRCCCCSVVGVALWLQRGFHFVATFLLC